MSHNVCNSILSNRERCGLIRQIRSHDLMSPIPNTAVNFLNSRFYLIKFLYNLNHDTETLQGKEQPAAYRDTVYKIIRSSSSYR